MITPTVGTVQKFSVATFEEVEVLAPPADGAASGSGADHRKDFVASTYEAATGGGGVCDDFVLEMHYKIYFTAAPEGGE